MAAHCLLSSRRLCSRLHRVRTVVVDALFGEMLAPCSDRRNACVRFSRRPSACCSDSAQRNVGVARESALFGENALTVSPATCWRGKKYVHSVRRDDRAFIFFEAWPDIGCAVFGESVRVLWLRVLAPGRLFGQTSPACYDWRNPWLIMFRATVRAVFGDSSDKYPHCAMI